MHTIYACYPDGKFKALTMSYDDGREFDERLLEIFNKNGIKGTFNLNSGFTETESHIKASEIKALYKGHEVATHTVTHPTIERCPNEYIISEVLEDRKRLEKVVGYTVRGLAYPNGSYNSKIKNLLKYTGIEYARITGSTDTFGLPDDLYEWKSTCHHNHNLMENAKTFVSLFKKQYLYLMYVWGHSYEFDRDNNWELIENFCSYVGHKEDIWYATNIEIVDYIKAVRNLKYAADCSFVYNPSYASVWISVDGDVLEVKGGSTEKLF